MRVTATQALATIIIAVAVMAAGVAIAKKEKKPPAERGHLVYGKGESLWMIAVNAKGTHGDPVEIAALGFPAKDIVKLVTNPRGDSFLVEAAGDNHFWVAIKWGKVAVVRHVCEGRATMSADGRCVLCQSATGTITVERLIPTPAKTAIKVEGKLATLAGARTDRLVIVTKRGIEGVSIANPAKREILATVKPAADLMVAPNGKQAVAQFPDGKGRALYGFVFDGKGVQRKLVIEATAVAWSRDSAWLVVTKQKRACVVRAVGGQYRCFDRFRALGLAPDLKDVLLAQGPPRSLSLYRANLGGARSATPVLLKSGAQGAALWLP